MANRNSHWVFISFVCRNLDCRFYGDNSQWIVEFGDSHFKCPVCLQFYAPWQVCRKTASGVEVPLLPFQKVCHIVDFIGNAGPTVFAAKWPGSEADSWLLSQAELHAARIDDPEDALAYMNSAAQDLHLLLQQVGTPKGLVHFKWSASHNWHLDAHKWPREGKTGWNRLETAGFWGNILPEAPDGDYHPFEQWHDLIALLSRMLVAKRALSRI